MATVAAIPEGSDVTGTTNTASRTPRPPGVGKARNPNTQTDERCSENVHESTIASKSKRGHVAGQSDHHPTRQLKHDHSGRGAPCRNRRLDGTSGHPAQCSKNGTKDSRMEKGEADW